MTCNVHRLVYSDVADGSKRRNQATVGRPCSFLTIMTCVTSWRIARQYGRHKTGYVHAAHGVCVVQVSPYSRLWGCRTAIVDEWILTGTCYRVATVPASFEPFDVAAADKVVVKHGRRRRLFTPVMYGTTRAVIARSF